MSGPYRSPEEREEPPPSPREFDLGERRSTHRRGSVIAGWLPVVHVYENGLAVRRGKDDRVVLPYDEIDAIHYDFEGLVPGPPKVRLVAFDGEVVELPSDLDELGEVVAELERKVTQPIVAQAREALARGERMIFGPLVVTLDGVELDGRSLDWATLSRVDAERDAFVLYAREPRGRFGWVRLREVPHPRALLEVLRLRTAVTMRGMSLLP